MHLVKIHALSTTYTAIAMGFFFMPASLFLPMLTVNYAVLVYVFDGLIHRWVSFFHTGLITSKYMTTESRAREGRT